MDERPYHHGNLRRVILDAALEDIAAHGAAALSLRALARRAGVSHAAPAHHFGDRTGLLTAVAAEGFALLADALEAARASGSFLDVGLAYVQFALAHPAHFAVMFEPALYRADDAAPARGRQRAAAALYASARTVAGAGSAELIGLAGWSLVHGFATLWLSGALPRREGQDPLALARDIAGAALHTPGPEVSADATPRSRRRSSG